MNKRETKDAAAADVAGAGASVGVAGAAAGAAGAAAVDLENGEEGLEEEESEEEESEEAQTLWSALFTFFPVLWAIFTEFAAVAFEAGICQYLALMMVPVVSFFKSLFGMATAPPAPPAMAPPAPPPPPLSPTLIAAVSAATFDFAESHPVWYLTVDFTVATLVGAFFLFLKDITEWYEARQTAARAAAERKAHGYVQLKEEEEAAEAAEGDQQEVEWSDVFGAGRVKTAAELQKELRSVVDRVESFDVRVRVHKKSNASWAVNMREEHRQLKERQDELERLLGEGAAAGGKGSDATTAASSSGGKGAGASATAATPAEGLAQANGEAHGSPSQQQQQQQGGGAGQLGASPDALEAGTGPVSPAVEVSSKAASKASSKADGGKSAKQAAAAAKMGRSAATGMTKMLKGPLMQLLLRTVTGVMAISLYFADIISDVQVVQLLWSSDNYTWAWMSIFLLVLQFFVVWLRVIPYLHSTFGTESSIYWLWLWLGFPFGLLLLDFLMFLEPFGLLTILPFPAWLKQFIPAYKATRVIAEVVIESLPQSVLQSYIYVIVIQHCGKYAKAGAVCLPRELAMMDSLATLPKSILISTLATLKTWIELVFGARAAGLTVVAKGLQLWHVGAGLPLDALKKGTIVEWACPYELDPAEIPPLIDALTKNGSLTLLNLAKSGITFSGDDATGLSLVEKMAKSAAALSSLQVRSRAPPALRSEPPPLSMQEPPLGLCPLSDSPFPLALLSLLSLPHLLPLPSLPSLPSLPFLPPLSSLQTMIIREDGYSMPVGQLREPGEAQAAVRQAHFFAPQGPVRDEILFMGDLLRTVAEEGPVDAVVKLLTSAASGKIKREAWEESLTQWMAAGSLRRGHLHALISAETLRNVGFSASELLDAGFALATLREGFFTALELRKVGLKAGELGAAGYTPSQLKSGGYTARNLKESGYSARQIKSGGYSVRALKNVGFGAQELKDNGCTCAELREGTFTASDLRPLDYSVETLREAGFSAKELKAVAFKLTELKAGGCARTARPLSSLTLSLSSLPLPFPLSTDCAPLLRACSLAAATYTCSLAR